MSEPIRHPDLELSAWIDGELDASRAEAVTAHVRDCAACAAVIAELRGVLDGARSAADRAPEADLWPGIAARIGAASERVVPSTSRVWALRRRFSFSLPQLAAAAAVVALLSGAGVWWAARTTSPARETISMGPQAQAAIDGVSTGPDASTADFEIQQYDRAIAELQQVLAQHRGQLDPETVKAVESNLALIDTAILQARRALIADPSSTYLSGHLAEQMKRKIRVLQRTADAATADYSGAAS